ncbi:MAG: heme-binding domain-containing protein [Opitutaceae bacterium]|nr:heme-binding domain-containing protein [Cytophagales bacterium]
MTLTKKLIIIFLIFLVTIQFFRPTKNLGVTEGPNHISAVVAIPENISLILKTSCYDCHSNNTNYPWYSEIMPLGWWLNHHVQEGKAELNFSEFKLYSPKKQDRKLEETKEEVEGREMPLESFTKIHKNAVLSEDQIKALSGWVDNSRKKILLSK